MSARRGWMAGASVALALGAAVAPSGEAETRADSKRPRGVVEDCRRIAGFGQSLCDFTDPRNLVVGPLALLRAGRTLGT